jgi:2-keto-3-deoxy-L-rhamnonate aldolase RhmA
MPANETPGFRQRLKDGDVLLGTFIKTPTSHAAEIIGAAGYDFVVIDEEHAPIDRAATDQILLACRAAGMAGLVRVPEANPAAILSALDCGATGVLVPHVASGDRAAALARAGRYRGGNRGFSNSPRAGKYGGATMAAHIEASDAAVTLIAMIEDAEAVDAIGDILAVDGIDAIFIGRGDLTVALGATRTSDPVVQAAVDRIVTAAAAVHKPVCVMVGTLEEAKSFHAVGVRSFIVSSDQGLIRQSAQRTRTDFDTLKS